MNFKHKNVTTYKCVLHMHKTITLLQQAIETCWEHLLIYIQENPPYRAEQKDRV